MAAEATLNLGVDRDKFRAGVQGAVKDLGKLDAAATGIKGKLAGFGAALKGAMGGVVAGMGAAGVGMIGKDLYNTAVENERAWRTLGLTLKNTGQDAVAGLKDAQAFADQMSAKYATDDEEIGGVLGQLMLGGYSLEEAKRQIPMVMDLAAAKSMTLAQAADQVWLAAQGESRAMKTLRIDVAQMGDKASQAAANIRAINDAVKGARLEQLMADPALKASYAWGQLKDEIAEGFKGGVLQGINAFAGAVGQLDPEQARQFGANFGKSLGEIAVAASNLMRVLNPVVTLLNKTMELSDRFGGMGSPLGPAMAAARRFLPGGGGAAAPAAAGSGEPDQGPVTRGLGRAAAGGGGGGGSALANAGEAYNAGQAGRRPIKVSLQSTQDFEAVEALG